MLFPRRFLPISIHAAREGGDTAYSAQHTVRQISIHAAREGGDIIGMWLGMGVKISIHAAREGGDGRSSPRKREHVYFNPRRP